VINRGVGIVVGAVVALLVSGSAQASLNRELPSPNPIRHVVIVYQENHSFDNVFGRLCAWTQACDGATRGTLPDGSTIPLRRSPDIPPKVSHTTHTQKEAIDDGRMDGFATIKGCRPEESPPFQSYGCFSQLTQVQIPNL
jgi:phospholipase C